MQEAQTQIQEQIAKLQAQIDDNKKLLASESDDGMKALIQEEITTLETKIKAYEDTINAMTNNFTSSHSSDSSTNNDINADVGILELRAGTGGDEAGLFAYDLYNMYLRYAENNKLKFETMFYSENSSGGIKTATIKITGKNVFNLLQNETGVHRVQRVPKTESAGRIHTSTATVAVLPQLKKFIIDIKPEDLKLDFFRSGGSGGQNVNKVSTAVRITHLPTGEVVECQEERTQGKNRDKAMAMLEGRLYQMMKEQRVKKITDLRSSQVGTGARVEKIRTYNYPQDRVTDHRISKSWHNIPAIMNGYIEQILEDTSVLNENHDEDDSTNDLNA